MQCSAIIFDNALKVFPDDTWFEPAHWLKQGILDGHPGGRGGVIYAQTPVGACVLRHYRRGGLATLISTDRYFWTGAARTRGFCEFRLLARLVETGLPVPAPIAARYQRKGLRYRADILIRRIPDAHTLAERLKTHTLSTALAANVGRVLAKFHTMGVWHADLNAHNVLIDSNDKVWLIDFDRGCMRRPELVWQQRNLERLRRSFDKLGARDTPDFDAVFWHPLLAVYHQALTSNVDILSAQDPMS